MSATRIVNQWRSCVRELLCPRLHAHQAHALADLSYAAALAGHCQAGRLAAYVPTDATPASSRRRFERLLGNRRLRPRPAQCGLARAVLEHWGGCTLLLLLDETPRGNDLRALSVRAAYARRAVPLAGRC